MHIFGQDCRSLSISAFITVHYKLVINKGRDHRIFARHLRNHINTLVPDYAIVCQNFNFGVIIKTGRTEILLPVKENFTVRDLSWNTALEIKCSVMIGLTLLTVKRTAKHSYWDI